MALFSAATVASEAASNATCSPVSKPDSVLPVSGSVTSFGKVQPLGQIDSVAIPSSISLPAAAAAHE